MWVYVVLSSVAMLTLFLALSLFYAASLWVVIIPVLAIAFAIGQSRRCRNIIGTLRQALITQKEVDRAMAAQQEAEAAAATAQEEDEETEESTEAEEAEERDPRLPAPEDIRPPDPNGHGGNGRTSHQG